MSASDRNLLAVLGLEHEEMYGFPQKTAVAVCNKVSALYGVDIFIKSSRRDVVWARSVAAIILMSYGFSSVRVASLFNMHHTSILNGKKNVLNILKKRQNNPSYMMLQFYLPQQLQEAMIKKLI